VRTLGLAALLAGVVALLTGCPPQLGGGTPSPDDDDAAAVDDDDFATDDDDFATDDDDLTPDDDDTPTEPVEGVGYGWYFGECAGACLLDLWLDADDVVTVGISDWDGEWYLERSSSFTTEGIDQFVTALIGVDWFGLQEVYGCPDCDDGGGEYVWMMLGDTFDIRADYEFGNPPDELVEVDWIYDQVVAELLSCEFDFWIIPPAECEPWGG